MHHAFFLESKFLAQDAFLLLLLKFSSHLFPFCEFSLFCFSGGGGFWSITRAHQLEQSWPVFWLSQNFCTPTKTTKTQKRWQEIEDKQSKQAHKRSEPGRTQNVLRFTKWMRLSWGEGKERTKPRELDDSFGWEQVALWMWRWITADGTIKKKEKEKWWMDETCMGEGNERGGD